MSKEVVQRIKEQEKRQKEFENSIEDELSLIFKGFFFDEF
jgi:hypothetical protein